MKTNEMTMISLMTALICVAGPLSISIGPIPITLSNFAVYLAAAVLGAKGDTIAVALYLLIGAVGVPVFSGFSGRLQKLMGVTGGYLVGYIPVPLDRDRTRRDLARPALIELREELLDALKRQVTA